MGKITTSVSGYEVTFNVLFEVGDPGSGSIYICSERDFGLGISICPDYKYFVEKISFCLPVPCTLENVSKPLTSSVTKTVKRTLPTGRYAVVLALHGIGEVDFSLFEITAPPPPVKKYRLVNSDCIEDPSGQYTFDECRAKAAQFAIYEIRLSYWEVPFITNTTIGIIKAMQTIWNNNASKFTGWTLQAISVDTSEKAIYMRVAKEGSIGFDEFVKAFGLLILTGPALFAGLLIGLFIYKWVINKLNEYAAQAYVEGYGDAKTDACKAIQQIPDLSAEDKKKACDAIAKIQPDPAKYPTIKDLLDEILKGLKDAVKKPTIKAPTIVIVGQEFEIKGECDPSFKVELWKDKPLTFWNIFKPWEALDEKFTETTSGADGKYALKWTITEQGKYKLYAKTGGKESSRAEIYALDWITIIGIFIIVGLIGFYLIKRGK